MNTKNLKKAKTILVVYLIVTLLLLFLGYSVRKPEVARQEFPFSITYSYQGTPFIFMVSVLSEIVADVSVWQQVLYVTPTLTILGVAASVTLRRCGYGKNGLFVQFLGPVLFAIEIYLCRYRQACLCASK